MTKPTYDLPPISTGAAKAYQGEIIDADKRWVVTSFDNNKKKKEKEVSAITRVTPDDNEGGRAVTPDASFEGKNSKLISNFQISSEEKNIRFFKEHQPDFSISPDAVDEGSSVSGGLGN